MVIYLLGIAVLAVAAYVFTRRRAAPPAPPAAPTAPRRGGTAPGRRPLRAGNNRCDG
mgnify:CR=1 FL=1